MKKLLSMMLVMLMFLMPFGVVSASESENALTLVSSSWYYFDNGKDNKFDAWFIAEFRNDTDADLSFKGGTLTVCDANGNAFGEQVSISGSDCMKKVLKPGDSSYICKTVYLKEVESADQISNCSFEFESKAYTMNVEPIPAEITMNVSEKSNSDMSYYDVTFESLISNDTDHSIAKPRYTLAIYDQNEKLIFAKQMSHDNVILLAGHPVIVTTSIAIPRLTSCWISEGSVPTTCIIDCYSEAY